ncbi:MAG: pentapeptide repeat-containing protein [Planctomycetota bacterium]
MSFIDFRFGPRRGSPNDGDASREVRSWIEVKLPGLPAKVTRGVAKPLSDAAKSLVRRARSVWAAATAKTRQDDLDRELARAVTASDQKIKERDADARRQLDKQAADDASLGARAAAQREFANAIRELSDAAAALRDAGLDPVLIWDGEGRSPLERALERLRGPGPRVEKTELLSPRMLAELRSAVSAPSLIRAWRNNDPAVNLRFDFSGVDLRGIGLCRVDLRMDVLEKADLERVDLREARLGGANLAEANLSGCQLEGALLSGACLTRTNLNGADLSHASINGADLRGAKLVGAILRQANLCGADLAEADLGQACLDGVQWNESTTWPVGMTRPPAEGESGGSGA